MKYAIKLEAIGHGHKWAGYTAARLATRFGFADDLRKQDLPWAAEITGACARFGLVRKFIKAHVDYSDANGVGSRGVMYYFALEVGRPHEIYALTSWKGRDRYFAMPAEDGIRRMTREEVDEWLRASIST